MSFKSLKQEYLSSLKSMDTEETVDLVFYRPLGFAWACIARKLGITPNAITIASIFLGIGAGICFYYPSIQINIIGMLLLIWANSFDSADGQLARMTKAYSPIGRILDGMSGDLWFLSIYVAICLRTNVTDACYAEHSWMIWAVAAVAGLCHAKQAAAADYYRQWHLFFVKGAQGSELTTTRQIDEELAALSWKRNFWKKLFTLVYRHYTANQEVMTPSLQKLRAKVRQVYGNNIPQSFCDEFRAGSKGLMKYTNILTFNWRSFALFISLAVGKPQYYFYFELTVMNLILAYMMFRHERLCRRLIMQLDQSTAIG